MNHQFIIWIKNLIPPCLPDTRHRKIYDVIILCYTPCLLPLITQIGQTFDYHSIINNMFHFKRLKIMHGLLNHGLI